MNQDDPAIQWLLQSNDPSVRYLTATELLTPPHPSTDKGEGEVQATRAEIVLGRRVRALLADQGAGKRKAKDSLAVHPGGFGVHPYKKWDGAQWRLVSLVDLGIGPSLVQGRPERQQRTLQAPRGTGTRRAGEWSEAEPLRVLAAARLAADQVLQWLTSDKHHAQIKAIDGRTRRCASQEGNALAVCARLGMTNDPRVQYLAQSLVEWQWDDGGWNCDKNPDADHSSFYESLAPLWGLIEYHRVTQDRRAATSADDAENPSDYAKSAVVRVPSSLNRKVVQAIERGAELFLSHRLFRSDKTGRVINPEWLKLHYPLYWHYDILQALLILSRAGRVGDPRASEALDILNSKRKRDGLWHVEGCYWRPQRTNYRTPSGAHTSNIEVVDWGRRGSNEMITLNALRVLKAAGR